MKTFVVIPAFNEEEKIAGVIKEVSRYVDKIVVVDDGSVDNTSGAVKGGKVTLLRHLINLGQGAALQTGFEYIKKTDADIVVTYDADGQFRASDIQRVIKPIQEGKADVVLGSRFLGRAVNIPLTRFLILRFGILFTYVFSNIKLTDTHNGFRAFTKEAVTKMRIIHNRWPHPSDIIYQISANRFKVVEVPVTVRYTKYSIKKGQSNLEALRIPFELVAKALFG